MTDIFDQKEGSGTAPAPEGGTDILSQLVGDGKKFKSVDELARGKLESDKFIEQLKAEQAELRNEYKRLEEQVLKGRTLEDVLKQAESQRTEGGNHSDQQFSQEELTKLVDKRLTEAQRNQSRRANQEESQASVLKYVQGDEAKAREFVQTEARRLGMSVDALRDIGAESPEAFRRLVGINQPRPSNTGANLRSTVNTEASVSAGTERDAAYYSKLRKELGSRFYDASIQQQRFRDKERLGERFYNRG